MLSESARHSKIAPQFGNREKTFTVLDGKGLEITTKEYGVLFDAVAGYWYNILGMRNPELVKVKQELGGVTTHLYEEYTNPFAEELATSMCKRTSMEQLIFSATGSMAIENARKEAVKYHLAQGEKEEDLVFVTINGSYHGSVGEMLKWIDPEKNEFISFDLHKKLCDQLKEVNQLYLNLLSEGFHCFYSILHADNLYYLFKKETLNG